MIEEQISEQTQRLLQATQCLMVEIEKSRSTVAEAKRLIEQIKGDNDGR